jgi:SAM-dependent methyltransferase
VGCAFGFFLSIARKREWDGYGVDLSAVPCRYACEELGLQVIHGALRQAHFADEHFDAAIMNDVFEHFSDPLAELAEVHRVRKTGGHSFIVTQDISSLMVRLLGCRCAKYKPREHLCYFTRDTLRSILEKSSFPIIRVDSESLVCSVNFLVGKLQNLNGSLGMLAGFLARKLRLQDALIPVRPGYEVIAYARKE